jgi:Na+/H+-translocating membrane pyrophosphatase
LIHCQPAFRHFDSDAVAQTDILSSSTTSTSITTGFRVAWGNNPCVMYLFPQWTLDTQGKYIAACFGTFFMAVVMQLLVKVRAAYKHRINQTEFAQASAMKLKLIETFFFGVQMVLAYFIMLIVMTYESLLFTCIILGLVTGHLITSLTDTTVQDMKDDDVENQYSNMPSTPMQSTTQCCSGE